MQFRAKLFEQGDITAAFVAEHKICADADTLDAAQVAHQAANKHFTRLLAEGLVEMNQEQCLSSQRCNDAHFLRQGINQGWYTVRSDDRVRVPVEGQHQRKRVMLARIGNRLADDLLMAQMHSIEEADGEA